MAELNKGKTRGNIVLIISVALVLLVGGIIYYYATREKPPLIYSVAVDLKTTYKLTPKPRGGNPYPTVNFYLTGEIFNISQYERVEILNATGRALRLLEELDETGLILEVERRRRRSGKSPKVRLNRVPYLEKMPHDPGSVPDYFIEVAKLTQGKKYIICEDVPWRNQPIKYLLALTRQ